MSVVDVPKALVVLTLLWTLTGADVSVSCFHMDPCLLPCSFQPGTEAVIHWTLPTENFLVVHSYYKNQDQLAKQDRRYRNRTKLLGQVSRGNASLLLSPVHVRDGDRYKCYTSTFPGVSKESFIRLIVTAPVRDVDLVREGNQITCSSRGLYPRPELTWSNMSSQGDPVLHQDPELLFSISSTVDHNKTNTVDSISCSVTAGNSIWKTTLFQTTDLNVSNHQTSLSCPGFDPTTLEELQWTFNRSQVIVTQRGDQDDGTVDPQWERPVEYDPRTGGIALKKLQPSHEGTYVCRVRIKQQTFISQTVLRLEGDPETSREFYGTAFALLLFFGVFLGVILGVMVLVASMYTRRRRHRRRRTDGDETSQEEEEEEEEEKEEEEEEEEDIHSFIQAQLVTSHRNRTEEKIPTSVFMSPLVSEAAPPSPSCLIVSPPAPHVCPQLHLIPVDYSPMCL